MAFIGRSQVTDMPHLYTAYEINLRLRHAEASFLSGFSWFSKNWVKMGREISNCIWTKFEDKR